MKIPCHLLQSAHFLGRIIPRYFLILAIAAISSAKAAPDENFTITELDLELIAIAPGTFQMGTPTGGNDDNVR